MTSSPSSTRSARAVSGTWSAGNTRRSWRCRAAAICASAKGTRCFASMPGAWPGRSEGPAGAQAGGRVAKRREPGKLEPVGPVVGAVLQGLGLERRLQEYEAVEAWEAVVGAGVAAHARATAIQDGVLFVEV